MFMKRFTDSLFGRILISVLLGLGLATLFRKVCKDRKCLINYHQHRLQIKPTEAF